MALYIEEGPNLPRSWQFGINDNGYAWVKSPAGNTYGIIPKLADGMINLLTDAQWIVVREEEPQAPEVHVVGEPLEGVADMTDAELGAEVRRRLDAFAGVREEEPTPPTPSPGMTICPQCEGRGRVYWPDDCGTCQGEGEVPSPPTPDVGWIGTHKTGTIGYEAVYVHRDRFAFLNDGVLYAAPIDAYTWEPPPEQEPAPTHNDANPCGRCCWPDDCASGCIKPAAAGGVPEPDPQPIGWMVKRHGLVVKPFTTLDDAEADAAAAVGRTVHAVMPAGWKPGDQR